MAVALAVLLIFPAYMSIKVLKGGPLVSHDIKPALAYLADHYQDGDEIYLEHYAANMTNYYRDVIHYKGIQRLPFIHGLYAGEVGLAEALDFHGKDPRAIPGEEAGLDRLWHELWGKWNRPTRCCSIEWARRSTNIGDRSVRHPALRPEPGQA